jgi:hypothetical protein
VTLNPVFDNGSPRSFGGISSAAKLADALATELVITAVEEPRYHAWGPEGSNPSIVLGMYTVAVRDVAGKPCMFHFEIIDGDAPLLIGEDVQSKGTLHNLHKPPYFEYRPGPSGSVFIFDQFACKDSNGDDRRYLSVIQQGGRILSNYARAGTTLAFHSVRLAEADPRRLAVRMHHISHATVDDMLHVVKRAGVYQPSMDDIFAKVVHECITCPATGIPMGNGASVNKVSFRRLISEDFGREVQLDYFYIDLRAAKYCYLHCVDADSSFGEVVLAPSRDLDLAADLFERTWVWTHGAPRSVGSDPEFGREPFLSRLATHGITFSPRPARRHNTIGIVERRNRQLKLVTERLVTADDQLGGATSLDVLVARANFFVNVMIGSGLASSFERVRGYSPSFLGIPSSTLPLSLLEAHRSLVASRALSRMLRTRTHGTVAPTCLPPGTPILAYVKFKRKLRWRRHVVVSAEPHYVRARAADTSMGPVSHISYHDVRLVPSNPLASDFIAASLLEPVASRQEAQPDLDVSTLHEDNHAREDDVDDDEESDRQRKAALEPAFFSCVDPYGNPERDIGKISVGNTQVTGKLTSDEQAVLANMKEEIGTATVTRRRLEFAPPWILEQAFEEEMSNWRDTVQPVRMMRADARKHNCVRSHALYKIKEDESGSLKLKCRLVPNGNLDREKDIVRKDSASVQFPIIRLILSLASLWGFSVGVVDVKAAYLQSGPISRELYVFPPAEYRGPRDLVWQLLKLPYGITEAGRQWQLAVESWLLSKEMQFETAPGLPQLFVKRDEHGEVRLLLGKLVDDFLLAGEKEHLHEFIELAKARFDIGKSKVADRLLFNGAEIIRDGDGSIVLSMEKYVGEKVQTIDLTRQRRKEVDSPATDEELGEYRRMAGVLSFLGYGALPQAAYCASAMLQRLPRLVVQDLIQANNMVSELRAMRPSIKYVAPAANIVSMKVCSFSDAAFNVASSVSYGQSGVLVGLLMQLDRGESVYHAIDFYSGKQKRVVYSSFGAEILACADADDRGYAIKFGLSELLQAEIELELNVDSRGLFDTITTLHEAREYRLRQTVQRIRDSFESRQLDVLRWVRGILNVADALTKRNVESWRRLNRLLADGLFDIDLSNSDAHGDADGWREGITLRRP